jgi:hypothetical protein
MLKYLSLILIFSSVIWAGYRTLPPGREPGTGRTSENKEVKEVIVPEISEPIGFSNSLEGYIPAREIPCEIEAKTVSFDWEGFPSFLWGVDVAIDTSYITAYDVDYDMTTGWLYCATGWFDSTVRIFRSTDNGRHWGYFQGFAHTQKSLYWNIGLICGRGDSNWLYMFVKHYRNNGEIYLFRVRMDDPSVWSHHAVATGADTIDDFSVCRDYRSNYGLYCLRANERRGGDNGRFHRSLDYGKTWDSQNYWNLWDLHLSPGASSFLNFTGAYAVNRNSVYYEWNRNYGAPGYWGGGTFVSFDTFNHYWPRVASVLTTPDSQATTWVLYEYNWRNSGDYDVWYAVRSHAWGDTWQKGRGLAISTQADEFCPDIKHYKLANYRWVVAMYTAADSGWNDSCNIYWTYTNKDTPTVWQPRIRLNDSLWSEGGWVGSRVIYNPQAAGIGAGIFCRGGSLFLAPHGVYMDAVVFSGVSEHLNKMTGLRISSNPAKGGVRFYPVSEIKSLQIYDASGKRIKTFLNPRGTILWDGKDEKGKKVSSGIYLIRGKTEREEIAEKLLFLQ